MLRALYVDLDGTLVGRGGSLFSDHDGGFTMLGARALEACARAGVEVVIVTGRRQGGVFELMRLLGQRAYIFELGCGLVSDGELEWLTGECVPSAQRGSIYDQIAASGAPELLLDAFAGRLEYHTPWSQGREVSHLFRGSVPVARADALLAEAGLGWLRLVDNGLLAAHGPLGSTAGWGIPGEDVHAYHLIPAVASKARAVAIHMRMRGYAPGECIACGDSREDLEMAAAVGSLWLVANGVERDPGLLGAATARANVRVCAERCGAGVYEAVVSTLAQSR